MHKTHSATLRLTRTCARTRTQSWSQNLFHDSLNMQKVAFQMSRILNYTTNNTLKLTELY